MTEKRRKFDRVFKENAVKLSYEKSSIKEFAEELGILPCIITRWNICSPETECARSS